MFNLGIEGLLGVVTSLLIARKITRHSLRFVTVVVTKPDITWTPIGKFYTSVAEHDVFTRGLSLL